MKKFALALAATTMLVAVPASATVIEDFETGGFGAAWINVGGGTPSFNGASAHDGNFGAVETDGGWFYRTDPAASLGAGSVLSAWVRPGFGRFYLGFGADANGASSFVVAPNTGAIIFQNNDLYNFSTLASTPFTFTPGQWYLASVVFGSSIVGNLYDSDGTTLLASLTAPTLSHGATGGVAVRSFAAANFDTISITSGSSGVPEPATWAMMLLGFAAVGASMRRKQAARVRFAF